MLYLTKDVAKEIERVDPLYFERLQRSLNSIDELGKKDNAILRMFNSEKEEFGYYIERYIVGVEFIPGSILNESSGQNFRIREYKTRHSIKIEKLYLPRIFLDYFVGNIKQAYILMQFEDYARKLVDDGKV